MRLSRFIFIMVFAIIFFVCTTSTNAMIIDQITKSELDKMSRIGVLSLLGNKIELNHVGMLIFNNKLSYQDVDWQIDQFVEELVKKDISDNTEYQCIDLEFSKENLSEREIKKIYDSKSGLPEVGLDYRDIEEYLKNIASTHNIDTLILIVRRTTEEPDTSVAINGYSLRTKERIPLLKEPPQLFIALNIQVIDLTTMELLSSYIAGESKETEKGSVKKEFGELSTEELKYLEDNLKDILKEKIPLWLLDIRLTLDYSNGVNKNEAAILAKENLPRHLYNCKFASPSDDGDTWSIEIEWCSTDPFDEKAKELPTIIIDKRTGEFSWVYKK